MSYQFMGPNPFVFWLQGDEVTRRMISDAGWRQAWLAVLATILFPRSPLQTLDGHRAGNPAPADGLACIDQILVHTRRAIADLAVLMDLSKPLQQVLIVDLPSTG
jgi:hypothetical protein